MLVILFMDWHRLNKIESGFQMPVNINKHGVMDCSKKSFSK